MPALGAVVSLQLVRGLVFTGIALLIVWQLQTGRSVAALVAGLTLSVLGGIAPLLVPNAYLPDAVRYAHLPEVGVSNFLFGLLAGWLLGTPQSERSVSDGASPAYPAASPVNR